MNKDFHYYATFIATRYAGFGKFEAKRIAWAAQMVDELNSSLAKKYKKILGDENYIITVQKDKSELGWDNTQWPDEEFDAEIPQGVRGIWMPFHFLPGHLDAQGKGAGIDEVRTKFTAHYDSSNVTKFFGNEKVKGYIDACMRLRCGVNSKWVYSMLDHMKEVYNDPNNTYDREERLIALGIAMHVLADTWAHEGYCGAPCYVVNKVSYVTVDNAILNQTAKEWLIKDNSLFREVNSAIYMGHGQIGHVPDYDFAQYRYYPRYEAPDDNILNYLVSPGKRIDNTKRFYDAIVGMNNALRYLNGLQERYIPNAEGTFSSVAQDVKDKVFSLVPIDRTSHEDIEDLKINAWVEYLQDHDYKTGVEDEPYLPDTFSTDVPEDQILKFARRAKEYRNWLLGEMDKELDLIYGRENKPISFSISEIDKFIKD